jgi:UDP-N-acetylmuramoyl-L-alanyl-D-glutamate--2,6-diaminopimelate ligase
MMGLSDILRVVNPLAMTGPQRNPTAPLTDDSRLLRPGGVFIAVKGRSSDGHAHIEASIRNGASVVIAERFDGDPGEATVILVADTRRALMPLALAWYGEPQADLVLTGVTGTNGKTTVTTLIWQVMRRLGVPAALIGTIEKRIGDHVREARLTTPGAMELAEDLRAAADAGCRHVVMEVSSHALDQRRTGGLDFAVGVFTNLTHDHLDYHKTFAAYARAKKRLFSGMRSTGTAILNSDDPSGGFMAKGIKPVVWDVSMTDGTLRVLRHSLEGLVLDLDGTILSSPLVGRFNAMNLAQAFLACVALGLNRDSVAAALAEATGAAGRLERVPIAGHGPTVFVDYAHTPDALRNVLTTLAELRTPDQRLHCVFGCGGDRDATKRPMMAAIAGSLADRVVITSDNPRFEDPDAILDDIQSGFETLSHVDRVVDRETAIRQAIAAAAAADIVLIAGKGHETYQEIRGVRHDMDDRLIAGDALNRRAS